MGLQIGSTNSIIPFNDIQRISGAITDFIDKLAKLEQELQMYRPKTGRTVVHFNSGSAGFLPIVKRDERQNLSGISGVKYSIEKLAEELARETKGYESDYQDQIQEVKNFIAHLKSTCDQYTEEHRQAKSIIRLNPKIFR